VVGFGIQSWKENFCAQETGFLFYKEKLQKPQNKFIAKNKNATLKKWPL